MNAETQTFDSGVRIYGYGSRNFPGDLLVECFYNAEYSDIKNFDVFVVKIHLVLKSTTLRWDDVGKKSCDAPNEELVTRG